MAGGSVTLRTSPLLYFYGMLSLAKALIVANEPEIVLDAIKYHGLKADKSVLSEKLEDQAAIVSGGVFQHLCAVVGEQAPPLHAAICLRDVMSISPELGEMYERLINRPCRSVKNHDVRIRTQCPFQADISIGKSMPYGAFERIPELQTDFEVAPGRAHDRFVTLRSKSHVTEFPGYFRRYNAPIGGRYFVGALPMQLERASIRAYVSPPLSDYIAMFILADCVRYKQDLWGEVVQGRETGILGLVDLLIAVSRRRFPNMVLDRLFGEHFDYGAPGRFT